MMIKEALPRSFQRVYPALDPSTPMLPALSLLRFHEIDALPLSFDSEKKHRAIYGFSCLAKLMQIGPKELQRFLERPCADASEPLATVQSTRSLGTLLGTFAKKRFGFARVEAKGRAGALVSLRDVLELYSEGKIDAPLGVKDVASPVFQVPKQTTVKKVLSEMFTRRFRRIFVSGTRDFVWDRSIINQVFSPEVLGKAVKSSRDILGIPISEFQTTSAAEARGDETLKDAAEMLSRESGQCLVFGGMVVTPWDVVMKPWASKKLHLSARA